MTETEIVAKPVASRARRITSAALIVLTTVLLVFAMLSIWAKRQVLDTDAWTQTSTELLQNDAISATVSDYLVDQLFTNVDVSSKLESLLPDVLKPLAGPVAGGLRSVATTAANKALDDPRVQKAWASANRVAQGQLVKFIEGDTSTLKIEGNGVVLDLSPLVTEIANRAGIGGDIGSKIPADAGKITVIESKNIGTVQTAVNVLQSLAVVLSILVVALFMLAIYLVPGRRIRALMAVGIAVIVAALIVKIARGVIGDQVVSTLSSSASMEPTVRATWTIGTSLLAEISSNAIYLAIPLLIAAWLGGRSRPAKALRHSAAPYMRDQPAVAWGVLGAVVVLFFVIVDTPLTRSPFPVLGIIALFIFGMYLLMRETAHEFPDANAGETLVGAKGFMARAGGSISRGVAGAKDGIKSTPDKPDEPEGDGENKS
ncbi:MAG: hypothetical protein NTV40_10415 [Solirubrobacterales bacterium]|nr:hypothetical protein [Solirubrobacterales bacterium]